MMGKKGDGGVEEEGDTPPQEESLARPLPWLAGPAVPCALRCAPTRTEGPDLIWPSLSHLCALGGEAAGTVTHGWNLPRMAPLPSRPEDLGWACPGGAPDLLAHLLGR